MRNVRRSGGSIVAVVLALAVSLLVAPAAGAHEQGEHGAHITPVTHQLDGRSAGQLLSDAFSIDYTFHASEHPFGGGDPCPRLGRHDRVLDRALYFVGVMPCIVQHGSLVLVGVGSSCSNVEDPPFFGATAADQRRCAREADKYFHNVRFSVDGGSPQRLNSERFEVVARQRRINIPADNILGLPPGIATFSAHGWLGVLRNLSVGRHVIRAAAVTDDGIFRGAIVITVVRKDHDG